MKKSKFIFIFAFLLPSCLKFEPIETVKPPVPLPAYKTDFRVASYEFPVGDTNFSFLETDVPKLLLRQAKGAGIFKLKPSEIVILNADKIISEIEKKKTNISFPYGTYSAETNYLVVFETNLVSASSETNLSNSVDSTNTNALFAGVETNDLEVEEELEIMAEVSQQIVVTTNTQVVITEHFDLPLMMKKFSEKYDGFPSPPKYGRIVVVDKLLKADFTNSSSTNKKAKSSKPNFDFIILGKVKVKRKLREDVVQLVYVVSNELLGEEVFKEKISLPIFEVYEKLPVVAGLKRALMRTEGGHLIVKTSPSNAVVYLDDIYQGRSPVEIPDVNVITNHRLRVYLSDEYEQPQFDIRVRKGETNEIKITIPVKKDTGVIKVVCKSNANVFLDNVFVGNTPIVLSNVPSGLHRLRVEVPGMPEVHRSIYLTEGEFVSLNFDVPEKYPDPDKRSLFPRVLMYTSLAGTLTALAFHISYDDKIMLDDDKYKAAVESGNWPLANQILRERSDHQHWKNVTENLTWLGVVSTFAFLVWTLEEEDIVED